MGMRAACLYSGDPGNAVGVDASSCGARRGSTPRSRRATCRSARPRAASPPCAPKASGRGTLLQTVQAVVRQCRLGKARERMRARAAREGEGARRTRRPRQSAPASLKRSYASAAQLCALMPPDLVMASRAASRVKLRKAGRARQHGGDVCWRRAPSRLSGPIVSKCHRIKVRTCHDLRGHMWNERSVSACVGEVGRRR